MDLSAYKPVKHKESPGIERNPMVDRKNNKKKSQINHWFSFPRLSSHRRMIRKTTVRAVRCQESRGQFLPFLSFLFLGSLLKKRRIPCASKKRKRQETRNWKGALPGQEVKQEEEGKNLLTLMCTFGYQVSCSLFSTACKRVKKNAVETKELVNR